jgi:hypothetical protein
MSDALGGDVEGSRLRGRCRDEQILLLNARPQADASDATMTRISAECRSPHGAVRVANPCRPIGWQTDDRTPRIYQRCGQDGHVIGDWLRK